MTDRVDFSRNAKVYDGRHGALVSEEVIARLVEATRLPTGSHVLDIAAGTGRVAIPFALAGYRVVALDSSPAMLASLFQKAGGIRLPVVVADGVRLPFASGSFDAAVIARLLYLVPDWDRAVLEAIRAIKPRGALLHEWGNGRSDDDWVRVREQARELFEAAGVRSPFHPGVRTEVEVDNFLQHHGAHPAAEIECHPEPPMTMRQFIGLIERGECSYTWKLPASVLDECIAALTAWARGRFDLDRPIANGITWKVFRLSA